ncbi:MAG: hypothetical protein ACTSVV_19575, partial [Promethearchaeota archaeon]
LKIGFYKKLQIHNLPHKKVFRDSEDLSKKTGKIPKNFVESRKVYNEILKERREKIKKSLVEKENKESLMRANCEFINDSLDSIEQYFWLNKGLGYQIKNFMKVFVKVEPQKNSQLVSKNEEVGIWKVLKQPEDKQKLGDFYKINHSDFSKKTIIKELNSFLAPIIDNVNREPYVVIRLRENNIEKNIDRLKTPQLFCLEIFDNGIGLNRKNHEKFVLPFIENNESLRKFQGIKTTTSFLEAHNKCGKPMIIISKYESEPKALLSAYYISTKKTKKFELKPEEIDVDFMHGKYIRFYYYDSSYRRGGIDEFIRKTALLNGHVNLIFISPYDITTIYYRKVKSFPRQTEGSDKIIPVGIENIICTIEKEFNPDFCDGEIRSSKSSEGIPFLVEMVIAYGGTIEKSFGMAKNLYRFVNRVPMLQDSLRGAIWEALTSINWKKNYKIDVTFNGLPEEKILILVIVSSPTAQKLLEDPTRETLKEDANLIKEIKQGLQKISRNLKKFILNNS